MPINKELHPQTRGWFQEWKRAEVIAQAKIIKDLTPGKRWDLYAEL